MIDANALREKCDSTHWFVWMRDIDDAPTVDAVEVVRCKDCKYHEDEEIGMVYCHNEIGGWVGENWFCADGKLKEGADND